MKGLPVDLKTIKNNISSYNFDSLFYFCVHKLHEISKTKLGLERTDFLEWHVLFAFKLILAHAGTNSKNKIANYNDFRKIIGNIQSFFDTPIFSRYNNIDKPVRAIAYQQFWVSENVHKRDFARQSIIFKQINSKYEVKSMLLSKSGVELEDYFLMLFLLYALVFELKNTKISIDLFGPTVELIGKRQIILFLDSISTDLEDAKIFARQKSDTREKSAERQIYENSPFFRYPLIKINNEYLIIAPCLVNRFCKYSLYDFFRYEDKESFSQHFGLVFERYIQKCLEYSGLKFVNFNHNMSFPKDIKNVDFGLISDAYSVLIEAKATELSWVAGEDPTDINLINTQKCHSIKAVKQFYDFINYVKLQNGVGSFNLSSQINFAFIVTYKELYFGSMQRAWSEFIKVALRENAKTFDFETLPICNIFFLTIDDLEVVFYLVKNDLINLKDFLEDLKIKEDNPSTRRFTFRMYLEEYTQVDAELPFLNDEFSRIFDKIELKTKV